MRAVIFGVDGMTFRVLHPLIQRGELPNFQKITREGCEAILESKYPPLTPPAWTSLSTGLKPARHGVFDFWTYEEQSERGQPRKARVLTRRRGGKAIWNILSEYGKQVIVVNVPATYPPEPVNGIMISGYMTPGTGVEFTYPSSFKDELFQVAPDYQIDLEVNAYERLKTIGKVGPLADAILRMTEERVKLIMHLLTEKPWDFCYIAFIGADRLQHPLWEEVSSLHPGTNAYFKMLDDALGQVLSLLGPDDILFIVSDHGFGGHSTYFDINEYLYSKGLLKLGKSFEESRRKSGRATRFRQFVSRLGLRPIARKIKRSLKTLGMWAPPNFEAGLDRPALDDVDWEHTLAYVPSMSGFPSGYADIFLSPDMTQEQIDELCADLRRQKNPSNGQPLIDEMFTTGVFGEGPFAPREPHLLLLPGDGITFRIELGNVNIWEDLGKAFGSHHKDGVLYAYGPKFKRGFQAPNAEIYDLVPTLLRAMDLPFPVEFDGRVLDELFIEGQQASTSTVAQEQSGEGGLARRKLKKLLEI
ncbi:MAG TPA: alkaline phosphatase family protein [Ktedonobacteraceae bacterium]|nr:alkaline phosphatase family protein [Ktedonobacteraceae bacterium]